MLWPTLRTVAEKWAMLLQTNKSLAQSRKKAWKWTYCIAWAVAIRICTSNQKLLVPIFLPVLGMVSLPPRQPNVPVALFPGSRGKVRSCWEPMALFLRFMKWLSLRFSPGKVLGGTAPNRSAPSCIPGEDDAVEELYTLILRLGSGSSSGELVIGILSEESCKAYMGLRYTPALAVKSGCMEGCSNWGVSIRKEEKNKA